MIVSESNINHTLEDVYILEIGTFYFFEKFIISEFNDGVIVDWKSVQDIIEIAEGYYGTDAKVFYISNRVHSYSIVPQDWSKFFKMRNSILSLAIVSYGTMQKTHLLIEKLFFKNKIKKFNDLYEAVDWTVAEHKKYIESNTAITA